MICENEDTHFLYLYCFIVLNKNKMHMSNIKSSFQTLANKLWFEHLNEYVLTEIDLSVETIFFWKQYAMGIVLGKIFPDR